MDKTISPKIYRIGFDRVDETHDKLPTRSTERSAGYDLFASASMPRTMISPELSHTHVIPTGLFLKMESESLPADLLGSSYKILFESFPYLQICSRSGLATKGMFVTNAPGIVDIDYKGEIKVILSNINGVNLAIEPGDKIAQLIPVPGYCVVKDSEGNVQIVPSVIELSNTITLNTERGTGGFGSTDKEQIKKFAEYTQQAPLPREQIEGTSTI